MLLLVLEKAKQIYSFRLYGICLIANHIHLLIKPDDASQLPKLMHWVGWYASMLLNRLSGRCGHFWEARYYSTPIAQKTTNGPSIRCDIFTPIQKQQVCAKGFINLIPTTATTADEKQTN